MRYSPLKPEDMTPRQREVTEAIKKRRVGGLTGPYVPLVYSQEVTDRAQQLSEYLRFQLANARVYSPFFDRTLRQRRRGIPRS